MEQEINFLEKEPFFTSLGDKNLRALLEKLPFPLFVVDPEEKILYLNAIAEKIYQCRFSTVINQQLSRVLFLIDPTITAKALANIFRGRKIIIEEWEEEQYCEGRILWRQGYFFPLFNQHGKVDYGVVAIIDITEWMRTEKALRKGLEEFRLFFEKSPDPILILKTDQIRGANNAWGEMMGGKKEEFFGKSIWEISPESQEGGIPSRKMSEEKISAALTGSPQLFTWHFLAKNGSLIKTEVNLAAISSPEMPLLLQAIVRKSIEK
ncbi:MAG TPA: PAS domain S-box protein [Candidatus Woesebacteria bacterium]|nr:PAS domain S-box protein [Candidatus Woesebacteria bacterium]